MYRLLLYPKGAQKAEIMKYIALAGADCPQAALSALRRRNEIYEVIILPPDELIDSPISTHPDTILFIKGSKLYCHQSYAEKNASLLSHLCKVCALTIISDNSERCGKYPYDCGYNALYVSDADIVIGNRRALCAPLRDVCSIDTRQGYAACCALAVEKTIITADPSMKKTAEAAGMEVFTVTNGDIALRGYDTGFIGGCTGVIGGTVFVIGDPDACTGGRELASFCNARGIELVSLCSGVLTDVGGIKFVKCINP